MARFLQLILAIRQKFSSKEYVMRKLVAALVLSTLPFTASAFTNEAYVTQNVGNVSFLLHTNTFSDFTLSMGVFGDNGALNWTAIDWTSTLNTNGTVTWTGTASPGALKGGEALIFKLEADGDTYYAGIEGLSNVYTAFWPVAFGGTTIDFRTGSDSINTTASLFSFQSVFIGKGTTPQNLPTIPEPETYAMLLAGLGVVGAVARRRRITV